MACFESQRDIKQFIEEAIDKLDDRPILVPYSRTEFKYKLEKIQEDVDKNKCVRKYKRKIRIKI